MDDVNLGVFILRVVAGLTFASHGWAKIATGGKLPGVAGWFDGMGMKPGKLHAALAAFTEIGAGLALALGLLTPLAGAAMVGVMAVAAYTSHKDHFFIIKDGFEYTLILAVIGVSVAVIGPGEWSLDNAIGLDITGWAALAISAGGGVVAAIAQLAIFYRPPATADAEAA